MCVYGGSAVPQGGLGDCHLATVPRGCGGGLSSLGWGRTRRGGGYLYTNRGAFKLVSYLECTVPDGGFGSVLGNGVALDAGI